MKKPNNKTIIEALEATAGMVTYTAKKLDVSYVTLWKWMNKSPELQQALKAIKESHIDLAETKLLQNVKGGDPGSIFFYLKCIAKDRGYVEKQQIEHSGDMTINVRYDEED